MIKLYFKQAWRLLKENPVLSAISIIGTALAICMIMVIVMSHEVKNAPYPPETNRDRMLYMQYVGIRLKSDTLKSYGNGAVAIELLNAAFKPLKTPETVSISTSAFEPSGLVTVAGSRKMMNLDKRLTDAEFWKVFDFSFVNGKPFTPEDVASGIRKAVIVESAARKLFGTTEAAGKVFQINHTDYTVCGVVKDVSVLSSFAYSQIWLPYTSQEVYSSDFGVAGRYQAFILAKSPKDFPEIRREVEKLRKQYNDGLSDVMAVYIEQPDTHFKAINRFSSNLAPNMKGIVRQFIIVIALLLIVPAVNLSSMAGSRMRKRLSELGVRRAYGATRSNLFSQVIWESMLQTLLGGIFGLILSFIASIALKKIIYANMMNSRMMNDLSIDWVALFNPMVFLYALLFCVALNLLSAFLPAWRVSRTNIVESILSK